MKTFTHCPICSSLMLRNNYDGTGWDKVCPRSHCAFSLEIKNNSNKELISSLVLRCELGNLYWQSMDERMFVQCKTLHMDSVRLPWFEPDLSDINKLINKVKILLTFS